MIFIEDLVKEELLHKMLPLVQIQLLCNGQLVWDLIQVKDLMIVNHAVIIEDNKDKEQTIIIEHLNNRTLNHKLHKNIINHLSKTNCLINLGTLFIKEVQEVFLAFQDCFNYWTSIKLEKLI